MMEEVLLYMAFFFIAYMYSSVGHGGASGYLAIFTFINTSPEILRPSALILNMFVSLMSFIQFYRAKYFNEKLFLYLGLTSIIFAYIGGTFQIDVKIYKYLLGVFLLFSSFRLFFQQKNIDKVVPYNKTILVLIGSGIGFISGLLGIGGGIILSPILLFFKWSNQKTTASIAALFIFINSLAGLAGNYTSNNNIFNIILDTKFIFILISVCLGGLLGSYVGAKKYTSYILKTFLAIVLLLASLKLIIT